MWPWSEIELLKSSLSLFAGEHVLSKVMAERSHALKVGGETCDLTMLFLDIASFTSIDEGLQCKHLTDFMNEYLELVTERVFAHDGIVDSYTGDAVCAWWNNGDSRISARNAVSCAREIIGRMELQNAIWSAQGLPELQLKIGINSGPVMLGNYGSSRRLRFTALGDNVNLAARLCGLANGHYSVPIIISGSTRALLPNDMAVSALDTVRVKGKDHPVQLFSLDGETAGR